MGCLLFVVSCVIVVVLVGGDVVVVGYIANLVAIDLIPAGDSAAIISVFSRVFWSSMCSCYISLISLLCVMRLELRNYVHCVISGSKWTKRTTVCRNNFQKSCLQS